MGYRPVHDRDADPGVSCSRARQSHARRLVGARPERGGRGGVRGIPIATELVIKVDPSQVTMESNTGSARAFQTFVYALDGSEIDVPGPLGWSNTASARWEGDRLVVSSKRTLEGGPDGPMSVEVIDVFVVEGDAMTIERRQGRRSDRLVYNRIR